MRSQPFLYENAGFLLIKKIQLYIFKYIAHMFKFQWRWLCSVIIERFTTVSRNTEPL